MGQEDKVSFGVSQRVERQQVQFAIADNDESEFVCVSLDGFKQERMEFSGFLCARLLSCDFTEKRADKLLDALSTGWQRDQACALLSDGEAE